jgi:hypothetical protein
MQLLGKGKNGKAYRMENGNVLKITKSFEEFTTALELMKSKPKWSVKILKAEKVGKMYHIEKEFVSPVSDVKGEEFEYPYQNQWFKTKDDAEAFATGNNMVATVSFEQNTVTTAINPFYMSRPKDWGMNFEVKEFDYKKVSKKLPKEQRAFYVWFCKSFFEAKSMGIYTGDLYQNIGINSKGQYCFFDLM